MTNEQYRFENERLKDTIRQWEIADEKIKYVIAFLGIFIFIPIGIIIGATLY